MPSLGDVANDVLARLDDIKSNTNTIKTDTNAIKNDTAAIKNNSTGIITQLTQLDADIQSGFTNVAQGLQVLVSIGVQQNQLLTENNKQNETIICWLTNIANTLCDIKHNTDKEVDLQTDLSLTLHHIDDIGVLVNPREAVEVSNSNALKAKMDECCPPEKEPLRPCFEICKSPQLREFEEVKTDWKPVKYNHSTPPK